MGGRKQVSYRATGSVPDKDSQAGQQGAAHTSRNSGSVCIGEERCRRIQRHQDWRTMKKPEAPKKPGYTYDFLRAARTYDASNTTETAILFYLIARLNADSIAYPSQKKMAFHLHVSEDTIQRGIDALESKGIVKTKRDGKFNVYHLSLKALNDPKNQLSEEPPATAKAPKTTGPTVGKKKEHTAPMRSESEQHTASMRHDEEPDTPQPEAPHTANEPLTHRKPTTDTPHHRVWKKGEDSGRTLNEENSNDGKSFSDSIPDPAAPVPDPVSDEVVPLTLESSPAAPDPDGRWCLFCGEFDSPWMGDCPSCRTAGEGSPIPITDEAGAAYFDSILDERTFEQRQIVYKQAIPIQRRWLLKSASASEAAKVFQRDRAGQRGDDFMPEDDADAAHRPLVCDRCNILKGSDNSCVRCGQHEWVPMTKPRLTRTQAETQYERQLWGEKDDEGIVSDMEPDALVCTRCNRIGAFQGATCLSSGDDNVPCGGIGLKVESWMDNIGLLWVAWDTYAAMCALDAKDKTDFARKISGLLDVDVMCEQKDIQRRTLQCNALDYGIDRRKYARELYESGNKWKIRAAWYLYATGLLMDSVDDGREDEVIEDFETWPWDLKLLQHLDDLKHVPNMQIWPRPKAEGETV